MGHTKRVSWIWLGKTLRRQFLAGLLVIVPIGATILIMVWLFVSIDNILQPLIRAILGHTIPGIGFAITVILIYLVGVIASNVGGRRLIRYGESLLAKVPIIRQLYQGIKQILEAFSTPNANGFMRVVLIEFPRKGVRSIGFVTNESPGEPGRRMLNIFVPTAPNPTSGFLQIVEESEVIRTNMSIDDALKLVLSAGRVSPKDMLTPHN